MLNNTILNQKILIVDDDNLMRALVASMLKAEGFKNYIIAKDGHDAKKKFVSYKPDIVFLDIDMPNIGGIETLHLIKEYGIQTQIIMLSGFFRSDWVKAAAQGGASAFLVKPISQKRLFTVLTECAKRKARTSDDIELFICE